MCGDRAAAKKSSAFCAILPTCLLFSVTKPENVSWADAAGTIRDGLRAYMALHTHSSVSAGTTVLVMDGANVRITNLMCHCQLRKIKTYYIKGKTVICWCPVVHCPAS